MLYLDWGPWATASRPPFCGRAIRPNGFDIAPSQVDRFRQEGGAAGNVSEVVKTLDAVAIVVLNAAQTESVMFGNDGVVPDLSAGSVRARLRDRFARFRT